MVLKIVPSGFVMLKPIFLKLKNNAGSLEFLGDQN